MRSRRGWALVVAAVTATGMVAAALSLRAADPSKAPASKPAKPPPPPAYLDAESAGPDYLVQGEYLGELTDAAGKKSKLGAQVVALGDGEFTAILLPGGLPGDGWDGKDRIELRTVRDVVEAGNVAFSSGGGRDGYAGGVSTARRTFTGFWRNDGLFDLKKVERESPTAGAKPPAGAMILFEGADTEAWVNGQLDERHLLATGTETEKKFQNFQLHLEFLLPFKPKGKDQDRGNSGVYIQKRYEVQILDSFGQPPVFNGTGALYRQLPPKLNMCYPPLRWQTYDIDFAAPKFDAAGKKTQNALITVKLNGVAVHENQEIKDKTGAGQKEGPEPGPIVLQGHGNPVFFRNVWIVEK